jgi:hypothetical protein
LLLAISYSISVSVRTLLDWKFHLLSAEAGVPAASPQEFEREDSLQSVPVPATEVLAGRGFRCVVEVEVSEGRQEVAGGAIGQREASGGIEAQGAASFSGFADGRAKRTYAEPGQRERVATLRHGPFCP